MNVIVLELYAAPLVHGVNIMGGWVGKCFSFHVHTYENFLGEPLLFRYISICVRLQSSTEMENERPEKNK